MLLLIFFSTLFILLLIIEYLKNSNTLRILQYSFFDVNNIQITFETKLIIL